MGLFGGGYDVPGPGVDKDAPKKKGIFLYFEIFIRKFWKLIQVNLLYFLTSIPIIAIYYILAPVTSELVGKLDPSFLSDSEAMATAQMGFRTMFSMFLFMLWGSGPSAAAYTYVTRNFVREEHSWIMSDFFSKFRANFKQGIFVAAADVVVVFLATLAFPFYFYAFLSTHSAVWLAVCYGLGLALVIYTFMHYYIYQLMITFECSIFQLYRNSVIMAFAKLPMNIVLTVLASALIFVSMINPVLSVMLCLFIWTSVVVFPIVFYTSRVIQRTFLDNIPSSDDDAEESEAVFRDERINNNEE